MLNCDETKIGPKIVQNMGKIEPKVGQKWIKIGGDTRIDYNKIDQNFA